MLLLGSYLLRLYFAHKCSAHVGTRWLLLCKGRYPGLRLLLFAYILPNPAILLLARLVVLGFPELEDQDTNARMLEALRQVKNRSPPD